MVVEHVGWALAGFGLFVAGVMALAVASLRMRRSHRRPDAPFQHVGRPAPIGTTERLSHETLQHAGAAGGSSHVYAPIDDGRRELAARTCAELNVRLLWRPPSNELLLLVGAAWQGGGNFAIAVDQGDALDAFHHPFAYIREAAAPPTRPERELAAEPALEASPPSPARPESGGPLLARRDRAEPAAYVSALGTSTEAYESSLLDVADESDRSRTLRPSRSVARLRLVHSADQVRHLQEVEQTKDGPEASYIAGGVAVVLMPDFLLTLALSLTAY
jgi:hypothetical protein